MRPILPSPFGDDWQAYARSLVASLQSLDIWGEVVRAADTILPPGSRTFFVEGAAPTGWRDASGGLGDSLLRVSSIGAVTGGAWQISGFSIANRTLTTGNLPAHQHGVTVEAVANHVHDALYGLAGSHAHSVTVSTLPAHTHEIASQTDPGTHVHPYLPQTSAFDPVNITAQFIRGSNLGTIDTNTSADHAHAVTMGSAGVHTHANSESDAAPNHTHSVSLASAADHVHVVDAYTTGGGNPHGHSFTTNASWRPAYLDVLLCERLSGGQEPPKPPFPIPEAEWGRWSNAFTGAARLGFQQLGEWLDERVGWVAPRGKRMLFMQPAVPAGWVQDTTWNDRMLRVANGAGGGTGGSWAFSGMAADLHFLTEAEIPAHTHSATISPAGAHAHAFATGAAGSHLHSLTATVSVDALMLNHFNGNDGVTTFTDDVPGITWSRRGSPYSQTGQLDTAQAKFGSASLLQFPVGTASWVECSGFTSPHAGDWTAECFVRFNSGGVGNGTTFVIMRDSSENQSVTLLVDRSSGLVALYVLNGSLDLIVNEEASVGIGDDTWYHCAVVRKSGTWSLFFNGARLSYVSAGNCLAFSYLGFLASSVASHWVDEARMTAVAQYDGATYTIPTAEFVGLNYVGEHTHVAASVAAGGHAHQINRVTATSVGANFGISATGLNNSTMNVQLAGAHSHSISLAGSANHSHAFYFFPAGAHAHSLTISTAGAHNHSLSVQAVGGNLGHSHSLSATGGWRPKYLDCIVAYRP